MICWALIPLVAAVSIALALWLFGRSERGWWNGLPGYIYFSLNIATPLILRRARQKARKP